MSEAPQGLPERGAGGRFLSREQVPERSPERQALATAIEYLSGLDNQLQRLGAARERLGWHDKDRALDAARRGLEEARARAAWQKALTLFDKGARRKTDNRYQDIQKKLKQLNR